MELDKDHVVENQFGSTKLKLFHRTYYKVGTNKILMEKVSEQMEADGLNSFEKLHKGMVTKNNKCN